MAGWRFLQLLDSAFPAGGFAHSSGLEAAMQTREVTDARALLGFTQNALWQAGHYALPMIKAAGLDSAALPSLDARADAFLVNHVANRQSRTQGRALLSTAAIIFPGQAGPLRDSMRGQKLHLHLAPLSGALYAALGLEVAQAQRLFLFSTMRGVLSAAVRLGLVGTHEAQAQQAALDATLDQVFQSCHALELDVLAQTAPIADLLSASHDRLYSRLFQS